MPCCIRWPPTLSAITVCGTSWCSSSKAVSAAPWLRGRVSSTQTWTGMPASCAAVDRRGGGAPVDGGEPAGVAVGEDVDRLARPLAWPHARDQPQPVLADRRQIATSSSQIAAASA